MKSNSLRFSKSLSPYAQALKQIALRGSVVLGPSPKEMDIKMYRDGTLPADYRPPVQGKWDDSVERWAYAWQFPAEEEYVNEVDMLKKNSTAITQLLEFSDRLIESPPSKEPRSGVSSSKYPLIAAEMEIPSLLTDSSDKKYEDLEKSLEELEDVQKTMMSADAYSKITNLPAAYLDDKSERSNASKELCVILEDAGLEYSEEGLIIALSALSTLKYYEQSRAIFDFANSLGLGQSAELYKCLMKYHTLTGNVGGSMTLIEEMKENGITPTIGNWHELMRTFNKAGDYAAVSQIVDNMKMYANIEPSEVTFALQLRALSKDISQMNSLAESIQLFDQMENVNGFIASRPHYDALMASLSQSPLPEMRLRCEELAQKMELMGITWNGTTYLNLIRSAQVVGDIEAVEKYLAQMRDNRIIANSAHLSWSIQAHIQHIIRLNYEEMKEKGEDILGVWYQHMSTCFGIYELVVSRGWEVQLPLVNALLRLCCQTTIRCMEVLPDNTTEIGKFEEQANRIWKDTFNEWGLLKDAYSYECYLALLAHQQRIDEAEKLFQEAVLRDDIVPSRRTYECMIFMHLSSGEEGGAARALHYLEAMEKANVPIRPSLLKKIVRVNNVSGYKRDMKRRARRIMQAREEYLAAKEEGVAFPNAGGEDAVETMEDSEQRLKPLPVPSNTTLAWWEQWKKDSISKHELFDEENKDGTPKGETFEEKNIALAKMGIDSPFKTIDDVPKVNKHVLLPKLREEGEVTGSLWGLDGGELSYPKDGGGPQGWGVRLWRERAILKKEYQKVLDGSQKPPDFSNLGNAVRTAGEQLEIEESGAKNAGELSDWKQFPTNRYDTGEAKPASEIAFPVDASAEFVWQGERRDALAPYKSDEELALESDNTFYNQMENDANQKTKALVDVLKSKAENDTEIIGKGATRRSKYDYLEKWREMYSHGTLEAPDEPLLRFGRTADDHHDTIAASVRDWYRRNKKTPVTEEQIKDWETKNSRQEEFRAAKEGIIDSRRKKQRRR